MSLIIILSMFSLRQCFLIFAKFVQKLYLGKFFKNAFYLEPNFELQAIHIQISIIKHVMNFLNALKRNQNYPEYDSSATFLLTLIKSNTLILVF